MTRWELLSYASAWIVNAHSAKQNTEMLSSDGATLKVLSLKWQSVNPNDLQTTSAESSSTTFPEEMKTSGSLPSNVPEAAIIMKSLVSMMSGIFSK